MTSPEVLEALTDIKRRNGLILPEDVVEVARDPDSPLHGSFTWDDTKAAQEHRLWQARALLRVCVVLLPGNNKTTRAFVSLSSEIGYRPISEVVAHETRYQNLLDDALKDLERVTEKYNHIKELGSLFSSIRSQVKILRGKTGRNG